MKPLRKGLLVARLAETSEDLERAQALRHLCFHGRPGRDADAFDPVCDHVLIEEAGQILGCFRMMLLAGGAELPHSYAAQSYDLTRLSRLAGPMLELGRFCLHPGRPDPDLLRLAWGALARRVEDVGAGLLFGCTSFAGAEPARHAAGLAALSRHVGPADLAPGLRATEHVALAELPKSDPKLGLAQIPPLLRSYLALGGWVSDHAVIDRVMDTLHVFTAVQIDRIPPARARALRALAME